MGLFGFGKKKEKNQETPKVFSKESIRSVKVFGTGCAACHTLYENTKTAADSLQLNLEVDYVTDLSEMAAAGIMQTPALMINDHLAASGKILKPEEITVLLKQA